MSEKNLEHLIETIKHEAIEAADKKAAEILDHAKKEAAEIIKSAEVKKATLIKEGQKTAEATAHKGENALKQAARDLTITLHNDMKQLFNKVLEQEVTTAFAPETIATAVLKILEHIGADTEIELSETLKNEVASLIHKKLQTADNGIKISSNTTLTKGFKIIKKGESWSYEITPEEVTALLNSKLNDRWKAILSSK